DCKRRLGVAAVAELDLHVRTPLAGLGSLAVLERLDRQLAFHPEQRAGAKLAGDVLTERPIGDDLDLALLDARALAAPGFADLAGDLQVTVLPLLLRVHPAKALLVVLG